MHMELGQLTNGAMLALSPDDRRRHLYLVGKSGTGKSTLLLNLMANDLSAGRGLALLDPHGDLAEALANVVPIARTNDTLYLDPSDLQHPIGFNILANVEPDQRALVAAQAVSSFKAVWGDSWGPRMEYILYNALRLLLDSRGTLLSLPQLLSDASFRRRAMRKCSDPMVRHFWADEFENYGDRFRQEAIAPIQNKVGALLASPAIRNIVGQQRSTLNVPHAMNAGKVLILNLSKGRLGEAPSHLLGALFISAFAQAAEARAAIPESDRRDFTLYVDEFQNFATDSFATILSEARKWRLSLVLAHQFLEQVPRSLRAAVIGNAGTLVAFRIGADDAPVIAAELGLNNPTMLTDTPNFQAWVKLIRNGVPTNPTHLDTLPPAPHQSRLRAVRARTRACHSRPRAKVEQAVERLLAL